MNTTLERPSQKGRVRTNRPQTRPVRNTSGAGGDGRRVEFQLYEPRARKVFLAGTFNDWDTAANPMRRHADGKWTMTLMLKPGQYEYKFVVDGIWRTDPMDWKSAPNPFDGYNSVLDVEAEPG